MRSILALAALALSVAATTAPVAQSAAPTRFSVILDYTPTGWSVTCETGCATARGFASSFGRASAAHISGLSCRTACNAVVDARGVITLANTRPLDSLFAFVVERTDSGVQAQAKWGTKWTSLSWGCSHQPCRARITDAGVEVL